jgi:hypothetical protein
MGFFYVVAAVVGISSFLASVFMSLAWLASDVHYLNPFGRSYPKPLLLKTWFLVWGR